MTNLQKLTDLLCEVEEVKKDIMELRLGTQIEFGDSIRYITNQVEVSIWNKKEILQNMATNMVAMKDILHKEPKIIGNPLQDYHLRMYCKNKNIDMMFIADEKYTSLLINKNGNNIVERIILEDKPLYQQSEETLGKIFNFLNDLKGK